MGGGGHLQKGTILYRVWRNDRWFVGNKKFGVVSHLIVGGGSWGILPQKIFVFFYPYRPIQTGRDLATRREFSVFNDI